MIISRTPFRISFFGGGTDYPIWYKKNGGAVLSTSFDKYCYITVRYIPPFFDYKYRVRYYIREETKSIKEIKHPAVRETLNYLKFNKGLEIQHNADLPARIGIGSSSAFTVGLLNALYALKGKMTTKRQLATESIHLEQNILKENVGSQDQVSCAFGGFNKIEFDDEINFTVQPITIKKEKILTLQNNLMLFFTGFQRTASDIAGEQIKETPNKKKELKRMHEMVYEAIDILNGDDSDISDFGKLLHETWMIKRKLTNKITTSQIDSVYKKALDAGALGGKILGAGGGGCLLLFVEPEKQDRVRKKLNNLLHIPICFDRLGSQIIYYANEAEWNY